MNRRQPMLTGWLAFIMLAGCAGAQVTSLPPPPSPTPEPTALPPTATFGPDTIRLLTPTGPHAVGRTSMYLADPARDELHTPDENDIREFVADIWYPAEPQPTASAARYMDPALVALYSMSHDVNATLSHAYVNVPLDTIAESYPVLLFNPGFRSLHTQYGGLLEDLASHGYVVVSIGHPYVTQATAFPGNKIIAAPGMEYFIVTWLPDDPYEAELNQMWIPDTVFMLDRLETLNADDPVGRFTGRLQMDGVGLLGHSFGGRTAAELCASDTRCLAALNMDGGVSEELAEAGIGKPYMLMAAGLGDLPENETTLAIQANANSDAYLLTIDNASHQAFADGFYISETYHLDDPTVYGTLPASQMVAIVRSYTLAFFNLYVRGENSPLLEEAVDAFPEVRLESNLP